MRIKALGYVVIGARDLGAWDYFMQQVVGAMPAVGSTSSVKLYRIDNRPFRFWIEESSKDELIASGYELSPEAFLPTLEAIRAAGREVIMASPDEAAARGVAALARTSDPAGNGLEFFHTDSRSNVPFISPVGVSGFVTGDMGMGHSVLAAPNFQETHSFYRDVVGFHDTDAPRFFLMGTPEDPGMGFAFMHADNGRHHSIALGEMPVPPSRSIHLMLEMKTLKDVGQCYDRMRLNRVSVSATLGQHVNDAVTSFYMQTPGGFDLEIGWNGLVIDPATWETTAHIKTSEWGHVWAWQTANETVQK